MKHPLSTTALLLLFFVVAQLIGLALIAADSMVVVKEGVTSVEHADTVLGPRPDFSPTSTVISILIALGLGTALALLLIKFNIMKLWKLWFFLAIFIALTIAFGVIMPGTTALVLAFLLTAWKVFKPDAFVQNLTELFVYAGIALLFVPLLNVTAGIIILLFIALYDAYAVWKSKHMVTLAKFQTESGTFAGLSFPSGKVSKAKKGKKTRKVAILGGGDIAFPLLFSGVVMESLLLKGATKLAAFNQTLIIVACCTIALAWLFFKGKENHYYPAMPFLSLGCLVGLVLLLLL